MMARLRSQLKVERRSVATASSRLSVATASSRFIKRQDVASTLKRQDDASTAQLSTLNSQLLTARSAHELA